MRVTWPHHELVGSDLEVHGWQHIDGAIHLRVTLPDESVGCLPATWTDAFEQRTCEARALTLTPEAVRALRTVLEPLAARRRRRGRPPGKKKK